VGGPERPSLARLLGCLAYQQTLLGDARRNRAFHRALAARVRPGQVVLDLGSGTGVWAVAAARLGARRVVAVEREAVLVPVIEALARENGVADRVEVVRADARRVSLPRVFDVVVSEMVGNEAFEEGLVPVLERARTLFLRKGGALVPEWVALAAAPVRAPVALGLVPRLLQSASVAALTAHVPRNLHPAELAPLAPGRELLRVDLNTARGQERLPLARARFRVADGRSVGGIAVWVEMGLAPGVRLSTRGGTHWLPTLLPVEPLPAGPGRLDVEIDWNPARRSWCVRFEGDRGARRAAAHAPLFAWGAVRPAIPRRRR
jgi:SAM-dependent methyltransferase